MNIPKPATVCSRPLALVGHMLVFAGAILLVAGCTRTVLGGFVDSSDANYRLYGRVFGAYGRSFMELTSKTVRLTIVDLRNHEALVLRKEYKVRGVDVGWHAQWDSDTNLTVTLFELREAQKDVQAVSNYLFTVAFRVIPQAQGSRAVAEELRPKTALGNPSRQTKTGEP